MLRRARSRSTSESSLFTSDCGSVVVEWESSLAGVESSHSIASARWRKGFIRTGSLAANTAKVFASEYTYVESATTATFPMPRSKIALSRPAIS